jgi:site-specific recombinase XerD
MRHIAASWLVIDGVPLYDVQALLGHESYQTTERYTSRRTHTTRWCSPGRAATTHR